jgi:hypothetical protein
MANFLNSLSIVELIYIYTLIWIVVKVQRNWLKVTFLVLIICAMSGKLARAQTTDDYLGVLLLSTIYGGIIPAAPVLLDFSGVWALVSVPTGVGVLYVSLVNESAPAAFIGTSFLIGGVYLAMTPEQKPMTQFLGNYAIWLGVGGIFASTGVLEEFHIQPIITPTGAGIRYRF